MKALAGDIDWQYYMVGKMTDYPVLVEGEKKGNYRVIRNVPIDGLACVALFTNQNVQDPVLRSIFANKKFRIALSLGINREELNELAFMGFAKPAQISLMESSPYYTPGQEDLGRKYMKYDPKEANRLLDEMGLKKGKDGIRMRPDGKRLTIAVSYSFATGYQADSVEFVANYLRELGIDVALKYEESALFLTRAQAGLHEIEISNLMGGFNPFLDPQLFPTGGLLSYRWAPLYTRWYQSGGTSGEEPKGDFKRLVDIYEEGLRTVEIDKRRELMEEAIKIHNDNLWIIGILTYPGDNMVIKNTMGNVSPGCNRTNDYWIGPVYPEQLFFKQ